MSVHGKNVIKNVLVSTTALTTVYIHTIIITPKHENSSFYILWQDNPTGVLNFSLLRVKGKVEVQTI